MALYKIGGSQPYILNATDAVDADSLIGSNNIGLAIGDISNEYTKSNIKLFTYNTRKCTYTKFSMSMNYI